MKECRGGMGRGEEGTVEGDRDEGSTGTSQGQLLEKGEGIGGDRDYHHLYQRRGSV